MIQIFETEERVDVLMLRFITFRITHPEHVVCMDAELSEAADGAMAKCCLDCSSAMYLSSYALGALVMFLQRMELRKKTLAFHSVRPEVYNALLATGLRDKMSIYKDEQQALEALAAPLR